MEPTRYEVGVDGESIAERYLTDCGMHCIDRRFRAADGEIDLIMQDGEMLAFVEVKYRPKSRKGSGLTAVTPAKQRRMIHAASVFLAQRDAFSAPVRFDVVEITADGIAYVPDAFRC